MLTKVLENKWVIRLFGVALIISPFINVFLSGESILAANQRMSGVLFYEFLLAVPTPFRILGLASVIIGILMLRGAVSAWRYLLLLLGGYIVMQFAHLGHHLQTDKMAWTFIAINVLVFFFIADQLVLKPRPLADATIAPQVPTHAASVPTVPAPVPPLSDIVASPEPPPVAPFAVSARLSHKRILIDLNGFGKWAKLMDISHSGLHVRCLDNKGLPRGLSSRLICVNLGGVDLQLRFARQLDQDIVFEWATLSQHQVHSLNNWIRDISA